MYRCEQEYAQPSLRDAESPCVDRAICPLVAQVFKAPDDIVDHGTFVKLQHERNVLEEYPWRLSLLEQSENVRHDCRLLAVQSLRKPNLRQILAREPGRKQVNISRNSFNFCHIREESPAFEVFAQDSLRGQVVLAKKNGLVASLL